MSTAQEIENAIRALSPVEREKLFQHIPQLFPEFAGDAEWQRIAQDDRPRPHLTEVLNSYENELGCDANAFLKVAEEDFDTHA